jgi:hypothetical protein
MGSVRSCNWTRISRSTSFPSNLAREDIRVEETLSLRGRQQCPYANLGIRMAPSSLPDPLREPEPLYCPTCGEEVSDPLTCGDCSAVICRRCGTPLESSDELGIG